MKKVIFPRVPRARTDRSTSPCRVNKMSTDRQQLSEAYDQSVNKRQQPTPNCQQLTIEVSTSVNN